MRAPCRRWRALLVPLLAAGAACGAPESRAARGPVAAAVETSLASGRAHFAHAEWGEILAATVREGLVDYRALQTRRPALDAYLARLAGADLAALAPDDLKALLLNAYNALTVRAILDHPRLSSIRQIDGVWDREKHRVGGFDLTLDEVEHNLLRPSFRDPRLHFAVNCASRSCAPLPPWAYEADHLDEQLEERTRAFLGSEANVRVENGRLLLSRYFDWYGADFSAEGWKPRADTPALFVAAYGRPGVAEFIRSAGGRPPVSFLDYDWSLNAAVPPDPALP